MANYVIICANSTDAEYECNGCTEEEAQSVADNFNSFEQYGGNCNAYAYLVVPNDGIDGTNPGIDTGVDVISEFSDDDKIQGSTIGIEYIKDKFNIKLSSVTFKKSSDKVEGFRKGLESSPKFTREEFDNNLSNLTKTINKNALMLNQVIRNEVYQNQNFNLYQKVEVDSTQTEITLWDAEIPSFGISTGSQIELKAYGILGSLEEFKTIRVKLNDEVILFNTTNVTDKLFHLNLDMIKSSTQSCLISGYTALNGSSIENMTLSETTVDWSSNIHLTITGEITTEADSPVDLSTGEGITLSSLILKLPKKPLITIWGDPHEN